ncbi:kinase, putative [Syntrophotalea carbinolica DSM 2380]|uniref:Kinase, putative n=1 Tax=Syntrophotalea carbinolica (strain DSM 2380 / NBRC 103641 / GraBd1) TaxID=338963 RepID=Q3A540_SYNC1|nr:lipopolysaccharide kinase InaA family protein [Syntrophotalea carbinolica]ABA88517.1 kinase, putative [Syntrophotalea carbinolica DSM 2380]
MLCAKTPPTTVWLYRSSRSVAADTCEVVSVVSPRGHLFHRVARRTQRFLRHLENCGCPAWGVVGVGVQSAGWLSERIVFQTRSVGKALPLEAYWNGAYGDLTAADKRRFVRVLGRFLHRLHDAGIAFDHRLWGELLVDAQRSEISFGLYGHPPGRWGKALSDRQRMVSLASLYASVFGRASRSERWRLITAYLGPQVSRALRRRWLKGLQARCLRQARRLWSRQARRCFGINDDFVRENRQGYDVYRQRGAEAEAALRALLPDPDQAFENAVIYKPGSRTHAGHVVLGGRSYFLKRYNRRGLFYSLVRFGRFSRARRTWLVTWKGIFRHLPMPRPLLCLEEKSFGVVRRSWILMDFFEGHQRLWHLQNIPEARLGHHLYRLGQMVGNMHASGFSHGDLKWDNILINPQQPAQVSLVDFDGSRVNRWVRSRRVLKDLRRFSRDFKRSRLPDGFLDIFMRGWHRQRYW